MAVDPVTTMLRREFLKLTGATAAFSIAHSALAAPSRRVSIVIDANDTIASSDPVKRAASQLRKALVGKGAICEVVESPDQAQGSTCCVLVTGAGSKLAIRRTLAPEHDRHVVVDFGPERMI